MLHDAQAIRYYQRLTDALVDQWNRGYRYEELRHYIDGYIAAMHHASAIEPYLIHQLEEEVLRFFYDSSNFETTQPEPDPDYR